MRHGKVTKEDSTHRMLTAPLHLGHRFYFSLQEITFNHGDILLNLSPYKDQVFIFLSD